MRNLLMYPVTSDEIVWVINEIPAPIGMCGDLRPMIKRGLQQYFSNPERMAEIIEQLRIKV